MMKRILIISGIMITIITALGTLAFIACTGEGGERIKVTLVFKDRYSGAPVEGVSVHVNGEDKSSDSSGAVSESTEESSLYLEGYINPKKLFELGYTLLDQYSWVYFAFTAESSFERTVFLEPTLPPEGWSVGGTLDSPGYGYIMVYSSDGRYVGDNVYKWFEGSSYSITIYDYGTLYFIVFDEYNNPLYYNMVNVTKDNDNYNLTDPESEIILSGDAGDAGMNGRVGSWIVLGEELINLSSEWLEGSSFSITVPQQGEDLIRLYSAIDGDVKNRFYKISSPPGYTSDTSEIDLKITQIEPVSWDNNLTWDEESDALSWDTYGGANCYGVKLTFIPEVVGPLPGPMQSPGDMTPFLVLEYIYAYVEGSSIDFPEEMNILSVSSVGVTPAWSDSYMGIPSEGGDMRFTPANMLFGTFNMYDEITAYLR